MCVCVTGRAEEWAVVLAASVLRWGKISWTRLTYGEGDLITHGEGDQASYGEGDGRLATTGVYR